mgnify:CR=1 FL=1
MGGLRVIYLYGGRVRGNFQNHEEKRPLRDYFEPQKPNSGRVRGKVGYLGVISKYI